MASPIAARIVALTRERYAGGRGARRRPTAASSGQTKRRFASRRQQRGVIVVTLREFRRCRMSTAFPQAETLSRSDATALAVTSRTGTWSLGCRTVTPVLDLRTEGGLACNAGGRERGLQRAFTRVRQGGAQGFGRSILLDVSNQVPRRIHAQTRRRPHDLVLLGDCAHTSASVTTATRRGSYPASSPYANHKRRCDRLQSRHGRHGNSAAV